MGLYISVFKQISKLGGIIDDDGELVDPETNELLGYDFQAHVNADFPGRADDVEPDAFYSAEETDGFDVGAYSDYDEWREELARLAGYEAISLGGEDQSLASLYSYGAMHAAAGPFLELIVFSDCDGVIGAHISRKLAADFASFHERAKAHQSVGRPSDWFFAHYEQWSAAFAMAADRGAVVFG